MAKTYEEFWSDFSTHKLIKKFKGKERERFDKGFLDAHKVKSFINFILLSSEEKKRLGRPFWSKLKKEFKCDKLSYEWFSGELREIDRKA